MEYDTDPGNARPANDPPAAERPQEIFSVRLTMSGTEQEFDDPRAAGEAFFRADPAERPSVIHADGSTARIMARTERHGVHETGEVRYYKSLPASHTPDATFRTGFLEAMESSLGERLAAVDWGTEGRDVDARLDARLKDDLEAFARREPEKAAALWEAHTGETPPGPMLGSVVEAREAEADRTVGMEQTDPEPQPRVLVAGDWVTTDQNVELRPVAVASDRGIHTGYEAVLPGGETELTVSERTFPNSREALRHGWDFYEGNEAGLETAVKRAADRDRDLLEDPDHVPNGLVIEHRAQPEFPRPETAIYAGQDAQLVLTLGRDDASNRDLAERLVADPDFRKVVGEHIPDADTSLGPGRFVDGEDSRGFLPDALLSVTAYGQDSEGQVLAKFPDEGPLSEALAKHLLESPVLADHAAMEREPTNLRENPARAVSLWMDQSNARIEQLPSDAQDGLRSELYGIAREAATAFGLEQQRDEIAAPPRSTLYSTAISATSLAVGAEEVVLLPGAAETLRAGLQAAATEAGIDGARIGRRLETGAANAQEENAWVKSDIADVAARHRLDLSDNTSRSRAAGIVDRFYEEAAELVHAVRTADRSREQNPLIEALGALATTHASQGAVAFRNEEQARNFAEEMKERYGASVLKDMAAGRTDALAKDVPDPAARQAMAAAVISAAKEHSSLGLSAHEAEAAERKLAADARRQEEAPEHVRDRAHPHDLEF